MFGPKHCGINKCEWGGGITCGGAITLFSLGAVMASNGETYWFSDVTWQTLADLSDGHTITKYIEQHYREWTSKRLSIHDDAFQALWVNRRGLYDQALWRAMFPEYAGQRERHSIQLSAECKAAIAAWCDSNGVPRRSRKRQENALVAQGVELFVRGWID